VRFSIGELVEVRDAAEAADLTVAGFCGQAALAVARRQSAAVDPGRDELAELQRQLFEARVAVNRVGTNLNQAVAALNATGQAPVWFERAVILASSTVERLDGVVSLVHRRLR
jgi:hypothetical protein